jgi:hypothetical protein
MNSSNRSQTATISYAVVLFSSYIVFDVTCVWKSVIALSMYAYTLLDTFRFVCYWTYFLKALINYLSAKDIFHSRGVI